MSKDEYTRLIGVLEAVTARQKASETNMIEAEKRFASTKKRLEDLLKTIENRRRNR